MRISPNIHDRRDNVIPIRQPAEWLGSSNTAPAQICELPVGPLSSRSTCQTIVLIGEDPLMLRALTRLLKQAGYAVVAHEADVVGREDEEEARACVVVVDVPDDWRERGIARVQDLVTATRSANVLWIGNSGEAEEYGPFHLIKPFSGSQLLSAVEVMLHASPLTSGGSEVYGTKSCELDKSAY